MFKFVGRDRLIAEIAQTQERLGIPVSKDYLQKLHDAPFDRLIKESAYLGSALDLQCKNTYHDEVHRLIKEGRLKYQDDLTSSDIAKLRRLIAEVEEAVK